MSTTSWIILLGVSLCVGFFIGTRCPIEKINKLDEFEKLILVDKEKDK